MRRLVAPEMIKPLLSITCLGFVFACGSPFDAPVSRLGTLLTSAEGLAIEVPDSAQVGQSFDIAVSTMGNGCVSFGGTEIKVEGRVVEFRPFDLDAAVDDDIACTEILKVFEHRASVQFDQPGPVTVRIHGMVRSTDGSLTETVIERIVEVR